MGKRKFAAMAAQAAQVAAPRMDLFFLGTASMMPANTRNVSATALRIGPTWWIFDVGEGTQHQMIRHDSVVSTGSISRIFITHLHGDHCFGLPGLMCKMGTEEAGRFVEIVGPQGLRSLLRRTLTATYSNLSYKYAVHELLTADTDVQRSGKIAAAVAAAKEGSSEALHRCEVKGNDLYPNRDGIWEIPSRDHDVTGFKVRAAPLAHGVPSVGYVIEECDYPGTMDPTEIKVRLKRPANVEFLAQRGVKAPMSMLAKLKRGESIELADGIVEPSDVLGPTKRGRKITILGDTCDSSGIARIAAGSDVLVHEATNSFIPELDVSLIRQIQLTQGVPKPKKGEEYPPPTQDVLKIAAEAVLTKTVSHGHSTPQMAAQFALDVRARCLILTHFSARYKGDDSPESIAVMQQIVDQAASIFPDKVCTARDMWQVELPLQSPSIPAATKDDIENIGQTCLKNANLFRARAREGRRNDSIKIALGLVSSATH